MTDDNRFWGSSKGRRVIVGLTVLVAAPVAVWMIVVFMRTFVAPPKVAAYRPAPLATTSATTPEPMPTALSVRSIGSFPLAVTPANAAPAIEPVPVEPAAKNVRFDPVPLPPRKPRILSAADRSPVPLPRPRPRLPL